MTDLRKAAEMALEACEHLHRTGDTQVFDLCYADKVIPALRQALAQEEKPPVKSYCGGKPNYCTPEEREWVGLTDDDVAQAMYRADAIFTGPMQFKFAAEIEAKLKEKNGG